MVDAAGLRRRSVAADNAAMEAEPTKLEPTKPKRRWFQFSLSTRRACPVAERAA